MSSFVKIEKEAIEYGVAVVQKGDMIQFRKGDVVAAWMFAQIDESGIWTGYSKGCLSGTKRGRKGEVADWCLDIAANDY